MKSDRFASVNISKIDKDSSLALPNYVVTSTLNTDANASLQNRLRDIRFCKVPTMGTNSIVNESASNGSQEQQNELTNFSMFEGMSKDIM